MYRTIMLNFSEEKGGLWKILPQKPSKLKSDQNSKRNPSRPFHMWKPPGLSSPLFLTAVLTLLISTPNLSCTAYSITSSHGPTFEYEPFNPSTQLSRTSTSEAPRLHQHPSASSLSSQSQYPIFFSANTNSDSNSGRSQYTLDTNSAFTTTNSNSNNNNNHHHHFMGSSHRGEQPSMELTPAQRQIASRILFESRITTPKPLLGYRSFMSSYRNRNYYVKKTPGSHDSDSDSISNFKFLPNSNNNNDDPFENASNNNDGEGRLITGRSPRPQIIFTGDDPMTSRLSPNVSTLRDVKEKEVIIPPWSVLVPAPEEVVPVAVTTPESKTAPATFSSASSATERLSSTQQMQSDGPYSTFLAGSESNNHYQFNNKDEQWISQLDHVKRPVQISPPPSTTQRHQNQHQYSSNNNNNNNNNNKPSSKVNSKSKTKGSESESRRYSDSVDSDEEEYDDSGIDVDDDDDAELDTTSQYLTEKVKGLEDDKEEALLFPTTVAPTQRTYKLPLGGNAWEDSEFSGLKSILELRSGNRQHKNGTEKKPSIIFPKENFIPIQDGAKEPSCAKKLGYCDQFDGYPKDLLNSVLTNSISSDVFQKVFGDEVGDGSYPPGSSHDTPDHSSDVVLAGRNGLTQETPLCSSQEVTIYPRVARNKDDKWMFIVNHDDYVQGVKVEKCMKEGSSCLFSEGNPLGYESVCRQKFILRKLVALNGEGKTALDTFKLPSCCVCYIKSNFVSERIGSLTSASSSKSSATLGSSNSPGDDSHHHHMSADVSDSVDSVDGVSELSLNSSTIATHSHNFNSSGSSNKTATTTEINLSRSKNSTEFNTTLT